MSQTAYGLMQTPLPGVLSDSGLRDVASAVNADSTWNIPFGVAVKRASGTESTSGVARAAMPGSSGDEILGFVVEDFTHDPGPNGTLAQSGTVGTSPGPGLLSQATFGVMRRGRMWVLCETDVAVNPGGAVYVRYSQNGAGKLQLGAARADGDTSHALQINAKFVRASVTVPATTGGPGNVGQSASAGQATVTVAEIEFDALGAHP